MKAITRQSLAYLSGVYHGDGYCTEKGFGLKVKDRDFAESFAIAANHVFECSMRARPDGKYWRVYMGNLSGRFSIVPAFIPKGLIEKAAWLRGMFDSEGNASLIHLRPGTESWQRRISFYNTERETIDQCAAYLRDLGMDSIIREMKASAGHIGSRLVLELCLSSNQENYVAFASLVGSSINRKMEKVRGIALSYQVDLGAHCRRAQAIGVERRRQVRDSDVTPGVLAAICLLIDGGKKPTQKNCQRIPGFYGLQRRMTQAKIVQMALEAA